MTTEKTDAVAPEVLDHTEPLFPTDEAPAPDDILPVTESIEDATNPVADPDVVTEILADGPIAKIGPKVSPPDESETTGIFAVFSCEDQGLLINPLQVTAITVTPCEGGEPIVEIDMAGGRSYLVSHNAFEAERKIIDALASWQSVTAVAAQTAIFALQQSIVKQQYEAAAKQAALAGGTDAPPLILPGGPDA